MTKAATKVAENTGKYLAADAAETPPVSPAGSRAAMERTLYGDDPTMAIVAVEVRENTALLYRREKKSGGATLVSATKVEEVEFRPWVILREDRPVPDSEVTALEGNGYNRLVRFASWRAYLDGKRILRDEQRDMLSYGSASKQFLLGTGRTLFKGMAFPDIRRMQVDIETTDLSPVAPGACIFLIACSDNQGHEEVLVGDEREMILRLNELVREWDPDVLEGHNFYAFDLPWLRTRGKAHNVALLWGRDGSEVTVGAERNCAIGANTRPFTGHYIWGRHILDTLFATQRFDLAKGDISSYGLKEVAQHYHIAEPNRVYLDRSDILSLWKSDPERVTQYAIADVRETRRLAEVVCPTEFYQTQMVPDVYQSVAVTGSGEKINSIFVRAYLQHNHAIARQQAPVPYGGGYTEMRVAGVVRHIVKADVESLYPSIMLTQSVTSSSDTLGLFLPLLKELTRRRLAAKNKARELAETDDVKRAGYFDGLQGSYKLLINSFYGYLGAPFYFNDYAAAAKVTEVGQEIVKSIAAELEARGATVIEIDTDGVYFQPPTGIDGMEAETAFVAEVGKSLPEGIRLAFDGRYPVMLSLKAKNYVLVSYEGKKTFKGSSLRSRADERFGRRFLTQAVDLLLAEKRDELAKLYRDMLAKIENRELGIEEISRRERVTEKTFTSSARKRSADAMAGLAVGDYAQLYQREDKALVPSADYANDDDIEYYQTKLYKFAQRLEAAIGPDFEKLFPKPLTGSKRKAKEDAKQQMALFDF